MPYSFRNRDEIRAPPRLDDPEDEHRKASYREPDIEEEVYRSSPPRCPRLKYRGPVTQFNPNLPPAAFPTLDDPKLARHQQPHIIQLGSSSESESGNSPTREQSGNGMSGENGRNGRTSRLPTETSRLRIDANFTSPRATPPRTTDFTMMRPAMDHTNRRTMRKSMSWLRGLRPLHDGTPASILEDNMRRMHAAGKLTSFDRNMLEMMSSEDDEDDARQQEEVRWDDLAIGSKLQLYDVVSDAYPSGEATARLQLKDIQVQQLTDLVLTRNERLRGEDEEGSRHRREVHEKLLRGARISGGKFRELLDLSLFQYVRHEDDDHEYCGNGFLSPAAEVEKAKRYLTYCRLNSRLLDGAWASIPAANAIALGRSEGNNPSIATFSVHRNSAEGLYHSPRRDSCDASDDPRSPSKDPRLQVCQRTPSHIPSSPNIQRESSRTRQSSGFIRPSIKLGGSTVTEPRLPLIGDFLHRPDPARIELIRARRAAIEANRTAVRKQAKKATSKGKTAGKEATTSTHQHRRVKRRASTDLETSFLNNERRPGARQPKLTEKAVDAEVALQSQPTATVHRKHRTCGGSRKEDTAFARSVAPKVDRRSTDGIGRRASQPGLTGKSATGKGTSSFASAMMREDSAIDLTADDANEDELG